MMLLEALALYHFFIDIYIVMSVYENVDDVQKQAYKKNYLIKIKYRQGIIKKSDRSELQGRIFSSENLSENFQERLCFFLKRANKASFNTCEKFK